MNLWLYTITKKSGIAGDFELKNDENCDAATDNFIKAINNDTLKERTYWDVKNLYTEIRIFDKIYINGSGFGLIGCCVVNDKDDVNKCIYLDFDIEECKNIIKSKIEYKEFDSFLINPPRVLTSVIKIKSEFIQSFVYPNIG